MLLSSIVGARPQFVKLAPMVAALATYPIEHSIVHTGQHYDDEMSGIFFHDLDLPTPTVNLGIGSGPHGWQTARMLAGIEETFTITRPDLVIVYGDTNSTLAGALAAAKLNIPVAHIEAGLRSYRKDMPEEINRVLSDHVSALLFTTTDTATTNLVREGFWTESIFQVGDVMKDAFIGNVAKMPVALDLGLPPEYAVSTIHRAENMGNRLDEIVSNLEELPIPVIFPAHPRTAKALAGRRISIRVIPPLPYLDMMRLVADATIILTDSGGLQR
jgi:UDP-N-acetylglucosamine 2-epimerase